MFLQNFSRLTFQLIPDVEYDKKQSQKIDNYVSIKQKVLSDIDRENIRKQTKELEIRQNKKDDPDILPKVTVKDVGKLKTYPKCLSYNSRGMEKNIYKNNNNNR